MERHAKRTILRIAISSIIVVFVFSLGVYYGRIDNNPRHDDYSKYSEYQLSWVIEGIQEEMSNLQDELLEAMAVQREKMENQSCNFD